MMRSRWHAVGKAIAPGAALTGIALLQPWLEQKMVTHMVVELPLLFAIGAWAATPGTGKGPSWLRQVNASGLTGLTMSMVVSAFWMLPLSLDAAVLNPFVGWLKVCSLLAAGWLTRISLREARPAVQSFFVLNWAWMTGAAGALYQQAPERLCSTYLLGDQAWAGMGLVALAIATVLAWMALAFREAPAVMNSSRY
ncbi:hypothetical protein [Lysobacter niastensis]|uniref:Transmembrane protein n=1 Tax=Lysobacter niastensis TaxID=380629 RepID=A0ABS0B8T5_9GAMM|nr:hypothetical protein [Lysobacter niastensis]MBF6025436.1 hypothetical protein [Lysobacter niastensis]